MFGRKTTKGEISEFTKNVFETIGKSTKKTLQINSVEDLADMPLDNLQLILLTEIMYQLKEININTDGIHDELWEANQRRVD